MRHWKVPAGFAAFGALVSLLAGILGGNPLGVVLVRLILSAIVCAVLGLGFNLIVRRYLPEFFSNPAPVPEVDSGEEVDIVIDEDIPLAAGEPAPEQPFTEQTVVPPGEEAEVLEEFQGMEEPGEEDGFLVEEAGAVEEAPGGETAAPTPALPANDFENLDSLPDIDEFSPAAEESAGRPAASKMNAEVEEMVRDQDPESLARAVRTFMKKDQ
jgi:hypothetical protein